MSLSCPKCGKEMKDLNIEGVDLDFCSCGGVWMDKDEFAYYAELHVDVPQLDEVKKKARETSHSCPRCKKNLQEMHFAVGPDLLIDRCPGCSGLWFDKLELVKAENIGASLVSPGSRINMVMKELKSKGYTLLKWD